MQKNYLIPLALLIFAYGLFTPVNAMKRDREAELTGESKLKAAKNDSISTVNPLSVQLINAVKKNSSVKAVESHLLKGAAVEETDDKGLTALHYAAANGNLQLAELLLKNQAPINARDNENGYAPLHLAAAKGHSAMCTFLANNYAPIDVRDSIGKSPLMFAVGNNKEQTVTELIRLGASIYHTSTELGVPVLHLAAAASPSMSRLLIEQHGAPLEATDNDKHTALHYAALYGNAEVCKELIRCKAIIDARNEIQDTPLHKAVAQGKTAVVLVLLAAGALIDAQNNDGLTPLHLAIFMAHDEIVKLLIDKGASTTIKDHKGLTPLVSLSHSATFKVAQQALGGDNDNFIELLLYKNEAGETKLHEFASHGLTKFCELLLTAARVILQKGITEIAVHVDAKDNNGQTALMRAARGGHASTCELLLAFGALVDLSDVNGVTPLHATAVNNHPEACMVLIKHNANIHAVAAGLTPLGFAAKQNSCRAAQVLLDQGADPFKGKSFFVGWISPLQLATMASRAAMCRVLMENVFCIPEDSLSPAPGVWGGITNLWHTAMNYFTQRPKILLTTLLVLKNFKVPKDIAYMILIRNSMLREKVYQAVLPRMRRLAAERKLEEVMDIIPKVFGTVIIDELAHYTLERNKPYVFTASLMAPNEEIKGLLELTSFEQRTKKKVIAHIAQKLKIVQ